MAASASLNRVKMGVSGTPGTGGITLGSANSGFATMDEAGAVNATQYTYVIEDGQDFEIGRGTYTASGTTFSRDTVLLSKISGVAGTKKLNLTSAASIFITAAKEDLPTGLLTARGDFITRDASGPIRRALGAAKTVLRSDGTDLLMAQLAAADLSDYEEGSYTPALDFGGAAVGMVVSQAIGRFIRIGKIVIAGFDHRITTKGSSTGTAHITGFPYAAGVLNGHGLVGDFFNMASLGGGVLAAVIQAGTSSVLFKTGSTSGSSNLTNSNFTNTSIIAGTIAYSRVT